MADLDTIPARLAALAEHVADSLASISETVSTAPACDLLHVPFLVSDQMVEMAELVNGRPVQDVLDEITKVLQRWDTQRAEHPNWGKFIAAEIAALALTALAVTRG